MTPIYDTKLVKRIRLARSETFIDTFRGINENLVSYNNECSDCKNLSTDVYPAICTRRKRAAATKTFTSPKGIFYKNGLFCIDGTDAYFNDVSKFTVTNTDKIIVGMGAYIVVFPDKKMLNTFTGDVESLEATVTASATFAPLSEGSAFTKITVTDIGNSFKPGDNVKISECSNEDYNGTHIIIEGDTDYIVISGSLEESFTDESVTFERLVPDMDFVCERDNRLWGCSSVNHEVYCCKVGDPKNWYNYEAEANNAWAATVGSDGNFTGVTKFGTYLIFFKEGTFHILRGDKPSNFSLLEKDMPGVRTGCSRSVITIDQILYYVSMDGVYMYQGAFPNKISRQINGEITEAVACQQEHRLYLSCKLDGVQTLLVYDTLNKVWLKEDDTKFLFCHYSGGKLHYVGSDYKLRDIYGQEPETIHWMYESGDLQGNSIDMKYVSKLQLIIHLPVDSEVFIYTKCDDDPMWDRKGHIRSTKQKTYTFPLVPRRCSKYRLKLEGKGQMKILGIVIEHMQGSELNGTIQSEHRR